MQRDYKYREARLFEGDVAALRFSSEEPGTLESPNGFAA
jgi:hypothetical protein